MVIFYSVDRTKYSDKTQLKRAGKDTLAEKRSHTQVERITKV